MKNVLKTIALGTLLLTGLSGCGIFNSNQEISMLNKAQGTGSPFAQQLTTEYRNYANYLNGSELDHSDAVLFGRKGLDAASGKDVLPESVADWDVPLQAVRGFAEQRARLMNVFELGARELSPELSAVAQSRFDCWIEQTESTWAFGDDHAQPCQQEYMDAIVQLEQATAGRARPEPMPAPAPVAQPFVPSEPLKNEDAIYLVFFDWDKSQIGEGGINVIDAAADAAKGRQYKTIRVVGHADTSGADQYNMNLGNDRASAVREALAQRGLTADTILTETRGESEPMVQTGDNVREPANRRATITFE